MPIVNFNDILPSARAEKRAVGAFNIANYETAKAVVMAAEAENAPVIIQVYQRLMDDRFIASLGAMMRDMAERSSVPIAVHLDHGVSLEQVKLAIDCGFTSVMLDGSQLPFEENVELTRKAAEYAHKFGVTIEGEIGHVPLNGTEGAENIPLSTPDEARQFALATGVDALAVSVGTAHGYYAKAPEISVDRAREINAVVAIPLVLHGGSDTPMDKVREVIRNGFAKVNVATEFQHAFQLKLQSDINALNGKFLPLDKIMIEPTATVTEHLRKLIRFFSDNA